MKHLKIALASLACAVLAGCASETSEFDLGPVVSLPKGEQISARQFYSEARGQFICSDYEEDTDSCSSLTRVISVKGDTASLEARAAVDTGDSVVTFSLNAVSRFEGNKDCADGKDMRSIEGLPDPEMASFVLQFTRDLMDSYGGVCGSYFRDGEHYVISGYGRDGRPFPPGDERARLFPNAKALRAE